MWVPLRCPAQRQQAQNLVFARTCPFESGLGHQQWGHVGGAHRRRIRPGKYRKEIPRFNWQAKDRGWALSWLVLLHAPLPEQARQEGAAASADGALFVLGSRTLAQQKQSAPKIEAPWG